MQKYPTVGIDPTAEDVALFRAIDVLPQGSQNLFYLACRLNHQFEVAQGVSTYDLELTREWFMRERLRVMLPDEAESLMRVPEFLVLLKVRKPRCDAFDLFVPVELMLRAA